MTKPRIGVIGVGSMGSMVLWQLAKAGVEAVGFEQFGIGHDRSAAGGESRMFRTAYMEGADYVPLLKASRKLWEELGEETGLELLTLCGGLMIGPRDHPRIANVIRSVREFAIDHEILEAEETMRRYPQHRLCEDEIAVLDREAGFMRPELAVFAAAERAEALGAVIHRHTEVEAIEETATGVRVSAGGRSHEFDRVIVTAGPWTARFFPALEENLVPRKIVMTWYLSSEPARFASESFPVFGRVGGPIDIFGVPALEGTMTKIGSVDTFGDVPDPGALHRDVELAELRHINGEVERCMNGLRPDPARISVHMDGYTTDEHAVVGAVPGSERLFVMGGYSGHGFKLAPVMGEIGKDLVLTGSTAHGIDHLAPGRYLS